MKKLVLICFILSFSIAGFAQRFAYVDTDYILNRIPDYKEAQTRLDDIAIQWQKEIDKKFEEIDRLYQRFQAEQFLLTDEMKKEKEEEIIKKEKTAQDLQKARFGYQGDLFKKREELIQPIQDRVYDAIQKLATSRAYDFILDKASGGATLLYTNTKYDLSETVLGMVGIKN